tara:strand:+ start:215 stop:472 length:258 start_codon:yes stop_codon:yes gene_type:complete
MFFEKERLMKVSQVIDAKNLSNVYYGWSDELQLTVEGGQLNIKMDKESIRRLATVLNEKIKSQEEEEAERLAELAAAESEELEEV